MKTAIHCCCYSELNYNGLSCPASASRVKLANMMFLTGIKQHDDANWHKWSGPRGKGIKQSALGVPR